MWRRVDLRTLLLVLCAIACVAAAPRKKKRRAAEPPPESVAGAGRTPASRAAALGAEACHRELGRLGIAFDKAAPAAGVLAPVRLRGPIGGVTFRTDYPDDARAAGKVPFEVFDCRLVVALSNFSPILRAHDVEEVRIYSAWRPPPRSWPAGKIGDRHPGGLAADLRLFRKSGGDALEVEPDFHGRIGDPPCRRGTPSPSAASKSSELRAILCAAADARLFHVLLTPNYDFAHRNHFHVEVKPNVGWFIVR